MVSSAVESSPGEADKVVSGSSTTTTLPSLPLEIQHAIILESFDPNPTYSSLPSRYGTLSRYSLVSRAWHALVEPLLHHDLVFTIPSQARLFHDSLKTDDPRPSLVRTLRVGAIPWIGETFSAMETDQLRAAEEDRAAIEQVEASEFGLLDLLTHCTGIEDLWLAGVKHIFLKMLGIAHNLRGLHVLRCSVRDCASPFALPPALPRVDCLEIYAEFDTAASFNTLFSSTCLPAMRHLAFACLHEEFPTGLDPAQITCLSSIGDFPPSFSAAPLLLLDIYQSPLRIALPHLPSTILILRLNDFSPTLASVPWLLVDHHTSDELAERLPRLRELWLPHSYLEWRDDAKASVREMVAAWVARWERRGVSVVFEEDEDEQNRRREPDEQRLTEAAAFDFPFARLARKAERIALEELEERETS
ncbi:hypothetical protein JCM10449v2_007673 [Rhodotorula kratochvilovae]